MAMAAGVSIPTYANVAIERHMLGELSVTIYQGLYHGLLTIEQRPSFEPHIGHNV